MGIPIGFWPVTTLTPLRPEAGGLADRGHLAEKTEQGLESRPRIVDFESLAGEVKRGGESGECSQVVPKSQNGYQ